jgi:hypothetical protein
MYTNPVLFITFARPEYARQTFNAIKKAKPNILYFYSNKARIDKPEEVIRNNEIREYVNEIDWECELKTYFREDYVDVYTSLWSALDWVFENEEQAIIFEEDCVPSLAFFDFCEQLLPKYKDDNRIWVISGNNLFEEYNPNGADYIFTRFFFMYGWASWKSRWKLMDRNNLPWEEMKEYNFNDQLFGYSKKEINYLTKLEDISVNSLKDKKSWDFTLGFNIKKHGAFGITPSKNLVKNVGIEGENNSEANNLVHNIKVLQEESYRIKKHPLFVLPDFKYDYYFFYNYFYKKTLLLFRIKNRLKRLIK